MNEKIQAFCEAQFVSKPFTLRINFIRRDDAEKIENEKISNQRTKEELSIDLIRWDDWVGMVGTARWYEGELKIKRTTKKN